MKLCIFLIMFSLSSFAGNWVPFGKQITKSYFLKQDCEVLEAHKCYDSTGIDIRKAKVVDRLVDDLSNPVFRPLDPGQTMDCTDEEGCRLLISGGAFSCPAGEQEMYDDKENWDEMSGSGWFLWCHLRAGYNKRIDGKILREDPSKAAAIDAADAAALALKNTVEKGRKRILFGQKIIALVQGQFASKELTDDERESALDKFQKTINALQVGSLEAAKKRLGRIVADSNVTQSDIDSIIAQIDAFLNTN